jgi:glycosyltransferase involved in cell wall biosynthesis
MAGSIFSRVRRVLGRWIQANPAGDGLPASTWRRSPDGRFVLVAADMPPMADKHAGSLRLCTLVRIMLELGFDVAIASLASAQEFDHLAGSADERQRYEAELRRAGVGCLVYGKDATTALLLRDGHALAAAFLSLPAVAKQFGTVVRTIAPQARLIYDMVDFHALRMEREAILNSNPQLQRQAEQMRELEVENARLADFTVAVSTEEGEALARWAGPVRIRVVPTVFEMSPELPPGPQGRSGFFFVGGFWHTPNVDAVVWCVEEIWPLIHAALPGQSLFIAGSNAPEKILALNGRPGVEVVGFVRDLDPWFVRCRAFLSPLRFGAGIKGKIGQSLAKGLPVVTTRIGAEGLQLVDGEHVLIADAPQDFARAAVRLAGDDGLWSHLQHNGRRLIEATQSVPVVAQRMRELLVE